MLKKRKLKKGFELVRVPDDDRPGQFIWVERKIDRGVEVGFLPPENFAEGDGALVNKPQIIMTSAEGYERARERQE